MKIVAFVPARGGSKRTPKKNLKKVLGVPLFLWAANNLNRVLPKEDIYIDSDSDEILELAKANGFSTIKRPDDLATNATNGNEFMLWEANQVDADIYIQHLPPMIFLRKSTLENAITKVTNYGHDSAFTVLKESFYLWDKNGPTYDLLNLPNSFTLNPTIIEGMGLYVTTKDSLFSNKTRVGKKPALIEMNKHEAIDIDYPEDFEFAETVANGLGFHTEYTEGISLLKTHNKIKLVVFDVDGVLTDGGMYYSENGDELKKFNTKDGMAIKYLQKHNIKTGILSSGYKNKLITARSKILDIDLIHVGREKKLDILKQWCNDLNINLNEVAYIGDDINDKELAAHVGLFACPNDAVDSIKKVSHIILNNKGGKACVREFIDKHIII